MSAATLSSDAAAGIERALAGPVARALRKGRPFDAASLEQLSVGALRHGDPQVRRWCLFLLDHYANDQSTRVFAQALSDPGPFVRDIALHSIACEACKEGDLCVADVVPRVVRLMRNDPKPDLRIKAIPILMRLSSRDTRAGDALRQAAAADPDSMVRSCAAEALKGRLVVPKKRYDRSQRRHVAAHH